MKILNLLVVGLLALLISATVLPHAQEPGGGGGSGSGGFGPAYPVECPAGSHLDLACAQAKTDEYKQAIDNLNGVFAFKLSVLMSDLTTEMEACQGDPECIAAAKVRFADNVIAVQTWLDGEKEIFTSNYHRLLKKCCVPN